MQFSNYRIGVIGYGNFGKVICQYLFSQNQIILYTSQKNLSDLPKNISITDSIEELLNQCDIIIPAVPIRKFEAVIKQLAPLVKPHQIIMDVCSVKEYPVEVMKKLLPDTTQIIATHPMFGPVALQTRKGDLTGLNIMIANISAQQALYEELRDYFKNIQLNIIELSPDEHDKYSAYSQFFAMIIGHLANILHIQSTPIDTVGFSAILNAVTYTGTFKGADKQIVEDMIEYNRYCREVFERMITALKILQNAG